MSTDYFARQSIQERSRSDPNRQAAAQHPRVLPRCANCDIEIAWTPTLAGGLAYCCSGCAHGGPCSCDYSEHENTPPGASVQAQSQQI